MHWFASSFSFFFSFMRTTANSKWVFILSFNWNDCWISPLCTHIFRMNISKRKEKKNVKTSLWKWNGNKCEQMKHDFSFCLTTKFVCFEINLLMSKELFYKKPHYFHSFEICAHIQSYSFIYIYICICIWCSHKGVSLSLLTIKHATLLNIISFIFLTLSINFLDFLSFFFSYGCLSYNILLRSMTFSFQNA